MPNSHNCNCVHILQDAEADCRNLRKALTRLLNELRADPLLMSIHQFKVGASPGDELRQCMRDADDALEGIPV